NIVSCLYFVPYIMLFVIFPSTTGCSGSPYLRQLPGNLVLRKFGVRNWITFIVTAWGAVQLAMGFVPTWGYLVLMRILLGALEVCYLPHGPDCCLILASRHRSSLRCFTSSRRGRFPYLFRSAGHLYSQVQTPRGTEAVGF